MKYYFLASYLPDLSRDERKLRVRLADLLAERSQIAPADWREIEWVLLGRDILILEHLLSGRTIIAIEQALHDAGFWQEQIKAPEDGPAFIRDFLQNRTWEHFGPRETDRLYYAYFNEILRQSGHAFLRAYARFEIDLRNVIAALRARRRGLNPGDHLVGEGETIESLSRSGADDFGLGRERPWIESLLAAKDPGAQNEAVEKILWNFIDQNSGTDPFAFTVLLAYLLKLQLIERRLALEEDKGMELVRQLEGM